MTLQRAVPLVLALLLGYAAGSIGIFGGPEAPVAVAQERPERQEWNYITIRKPGAAVVAAGPENLASLARGKGTKGWELCGVVRVDNDLVGFMKRTARD